MRSLLLKELRSLLPFLALVLFFILLGAVYLILSEFPDQYPLSKLLEPDEGEQAVTFVLAFALASGLLVRERDEGTLAFLDALPVSRSRIFWCKVTLALGVLWLLPLSDLALKAIVHAWSRTSLETHFQWQLLWMGTGLEAASCFVYFALGLVLSFLRRFSLLVVGLCICAYLCLQEARAPLISLLNIFSLNDPVFRGQRWLLPTAQLGTQLLLGCAAMGVAYAAFLRLNEVMPQFALDAKRRKRATVLAALGTTLLVLIWAGLAVYWLEKNGSRDKPKVQYTQWALSRAKTSRYEFIYPENQAGLISQLIERSDAAEARVRAFLDARPATRIEADLTGSAPQTGGQAHWKKVQMDLAAAGRDVDSVLAVLAHETTHVYIDLESQTHIGDDFNSTRFFHEGLASYVEYHLFRPGNKLASLRRVAATMRARGEAKLDELFDDQTLTLKRDPDLVYPLGEMFVAALVRRYGESAPGRVVKAFGRPKAPKNLKGFGLWQDALQACGYNLSEVEDTFYAELDEVAAQQRAFIEGLPRLRGAAQRDRTRLGVLASFVGEAPGSLVCRFRPQSDTPSRLYENSFAEPGEPFWVEKSGYMERSFWYQLGWRVNGASLAIYEPWVEVRRDR